MNPLISKLIATELYLNRWMIAISIVLGLIALSICAGGKTAYGVGFIAWITLVISFGVMLPMFAVLRERKERALLFVLSLPLSPRDYVLAKLFGVALCFFIFWLVMSAAVATLVLVSPAPDGGLPITVLLCVFLLMNFCIVLSSSLHMRSESQLVGVIIGTNMCVSLFFMLVGATPALNDHRDGATAVWNTEFWLALAAFLTVMLLALAAPLVFASRRRDFL